MCIRDRSYTSFSIGNVQPDKTQIKNNESLRLTIPVSNKGKRDGTEVVQVYVHKVNDVDSAIKTLRGFQRVEVGAGKTNNAVIPVPYSACLLYTSPSPRDS